MKKEKEKNGVFSGHYVIASSLPPERLRPNGYARTTTAGTPHARANIQPNVQPDILKWLPGSGKVMKGGSDSKRSCRLVQAQTH